MSYLIAETHDVQFHHDVSLMKIGNEYSVIFASEETGMWSKRFSSIEAAIAHYQKYVEAFIRGNYSAEQRASWNKD